MKCVKAEFLSLAPILEGLLLLVKLLSVAVGLALAKVSSCSPFHMSASQILLFCDCWIAEKRNILHT